MAYFVEKIELVINRLAEELIVAIALDCLSPVHFANYIGCTRSSILDPVPVTVLEHQFLIGILTEARP